MTLFVLPSKFEGAFEPVNGVEAPPNLPLASNPTFTEDQVMAGRPVAENRGKELEIGEPMMGADQSLLQDPIGGMMKIVPSDIDVSAASLQIICIISSLVKYLFTCLLILGILQRCNHFVMLCGMF